MTRAECTADARFPLRAVPNQSILIFLAALCPIPLSDGLHIILRYGQKGSAVLNEASWGGLETEADTRVEGRLSLAKHTHRICRDPSVSDLTGFPFITTHFGHPRYCWGTQSPRLRLRISCDLPANSPLALMTLGKIWNRVVISPGRNCLQRSLPEIL
mgnify:CR=1 FL=1